MCLLLQPNHTITPGSTGDPFCSGLLPGSWLLSSVRTRTTSRAHLPIVLCVCSAGATGTCTPQRTQRSQTEGLVSIAHTHPLRVCLLRYKKGLGAQSDPDRGDMRRLLNSNSLALSHHRSPQRRPETWRNKELLQGTGTLVLADPGPVNRI